MFEFLQGILFVGLMVTGVFGPICVMGHVFGLREKRKEAKKRKEWEAEKEVNRIRALTDTPYTIYTI